MLCTESPPRTAAPEQSRAVQADCFPFPGGTARVLSRAQLDESSTRQEIFARLCKDFRYYELVAETLTGGFDYQFLLLEDVTGAVRAIQPVFFARQNICEGLSGRLRRGIDAVQRHFPRFLTMETLMVGCSAGEGHLGICSPANEAWAARALLAVLKPYALSRNASFMVLKDFPATYRETFECLIANGYTRIPSAPMTTLKLGYRDFEEYLGTLGRATRKNLRRKFRRAEAVAPIDLTVVNDISKFIDEIFPLYLQVHKRSRFRFERLTQEYFCALGKRMPDRARFFIWRQKGKTIAFSLCLVKDGTIHDECLGLDYAVALDLHLYFYTLRDIIRWSLAEGLERYSSGPLNYHPKFHLGCDLLPLDLYVMHTSPWLNPIFRPVLTFLGPTRHDPVLRRFRNAHEL